MVDTAQAVMGLWHPGQEQDISISHLLHAFARTDPAPNRAWSVNTTILLKLVGMPRPQKFSEEHWLVVCQLAAMGFYYLLQPGKYAKSRSNAEDHDTLGKPFHLRHASFLLTNAKYHAAHQLTPRCNCRCKDFELSTMHMAMLSFDGQKSAAKGDQVCQQHIGGSLCRGTALYHCVYSLKDHLGKKTMHPDSINAPLCSYFVPATAKKKHRWANVTTSQLTAALRLAADHCKDCTGIPPKLINTRSLHTGGATTLLCAGVGKDITKILGHWRSDAVDVYLHTSTHTATAGFSKKMFNAGGHKFAPKQESSTPPISSLKRHHPMPRMSTSANLWCTTTTATPSMTQSWAHWPLRVAPHNSSPDPNRRLHLHSTILHALLRRPSSIQPRLSPRLQKSHSSSHPLFTTMAHRFFDLVEGKGRCSEGLSKPP